MNLWVKRIGQLTLVAVALFFFSCQDDISQLGFKNPNSKLDMSYAEITLESSVYLVDSVSTSNYSNALNRVLVGAYDDADLGKIKTTGFSHFFPPAGKLDDRPRLDSIALQLRFDYYAYGSPGATTQTFDIHEVSEDMSLSKTYYTKTPTAYFITPLGTGSAVVDGAAFKTEFDKTDAQKDTTVLNIRLSDVFGQRVLTTIKDSESQTNLSKKDSVFRAAIKGLAIVPGTANDKVVGFDYNNIINSGSVLSRVILYYHTVDENEVLKEDSLRVSLALGGVTYTKLDADRSSTADLSALTNENFYQAIQPPVYRYAQNGTGVTLKIDFQKFFDFADQNPNILINSCQLAINDIEGAEQYRPIGSFTLRVMNENNNRYRRTKYQPVTNVNGDTIQYVVSDSDAKELGSYGSKLTQSLTDAGGYFGVVDDASNTALLVRDGNNYSTYLSLFAQQLYNKKNGVNRYRYYGLVPNDPPTGKSVNRLKFNKDNLKLKIFYTVPTEAD